ncbi:MAG: CYTH and CHAD domain-containing protein [Alphaproteobacteria bacterium]|nr:CYTH and CHAD domain-containing protein [Alphaproteobacteria bacterium SS10]
MTGTAAKQEISDTKAPLVMQEVELKFTLPRSNLTELSDGEWFNGIATAINQEDQKLISRYYDTPNCDFQRLGAALRIRNKGGKWLQHLKWKDRTGSVAGGTSRTELEWQLGEGSTTPTPDTDMIIAGVDADKLKLPEGWEDTLAPVFESDVNRLAQTVQIGNSKVELALDRGSLKTDATERPLSEVELELVEGAVADIYRLAERLVQVSGARLAAGSKAAQGYHLAQGTRPSATKSEAAPLKRGETARDALAQQAGQTLADLMANQTVVLEDAGPEGVHQMRVALRRMDAIVRPLRPWLTSKAAIELMEDLRWLRQSLGPLRNWDVFLTETLVELSPDHGNTDDIPSSTKRKAKSTDLPAMIRPAVNALRQAAKTQVFKTLNDHRYADLLLRLALIASGGAKGLGRTAGDEKHLAQPFQGIAARWLIEQQLTMSARGQRLDAIAPARQHRFRLKIKKTRYVAELLRSIDLKKPLKRLSKQMARLQDRLGHQNDVFTALELMEEVRLHPMLEHDVDARAGIDKQLKSWRKELKDKDPGITQLWLEIEAAGDDWIIARR